MARPPLEPIVPVGPADLNIFIPRDSSPTVTPATGSNFPASPPTSSLSEPSHYPLQRCTSSPSQRRPGTRHQSSISYLPADSPRLWTPRTPHIGFDTLERTVSLSGAKMKGGHARTGSILQQTGSEPAVLTLAERCVPPFSIFHNWCIHEEKKKTLFFRKKKKKKGMRISSSLSHRRSPSASNSVLSFQYTSLSSTNSSASGSASCVASLAVAFRQRRHLPPPRRQRLRPLPRWRT